MKSDTWNLPAISDENIDIKDVEFMFNQAAKRLEGTITNADLITVRSTNVLTIIASILTASLAFVVSNWKGINNLTHSQTTACVAALYSLLVGIFLIGNIFPYLFHYAGSKPRDLCVLDFFNERDKNKRLVNIYLNELKDYNKRIEINWSKNDDRLFKYRWALMALYLMPCVLAIIFLILEA